MAPAMQADHRHRFFEVSAGEGQQSIAARADTPLALTPALSQRERGQYRDATAHGRRTGNQNTGMMSSMSASDTSWPVMPTSGIAGKGML